MRGRQEGRIPHVFLVGGEPYEILEVVVVCGVVLLDTADVLSVQGASYADEMGPFRRLVAT